VVFNKFRAVLGGRVRQMITGSAPISKDTLNFLKIAFCCQINEGFGQTECAAPASLTWTNDPLTGHVGGPYPACDFKLVDIPDMGYTAKDTDEQGNPMPRGEICYKGWNCFKGYFRNPEATAEAIDAAGWVHTGDVGTILPHGAIKIIDRKKNIFKLSQGEYVVPEKLENKFCQHPLIAQCFVYGDSL
jgi:long-chain acyl-CoA synthetase